MAVITGGPFPAVDLDGYLVLRGIIDLHGTAPDLGPTQPAGSTALLHRHDRMAASLGVTTAWVSQRWYNPPRAADGRPLVAVQRSSVMPAFRYPRSRPSSAPASRIDDKSVTPA